MKVFHLAPYYPPHLGGLQIAVKNLANAQFEAGQKVTVITSRQGRILSQNESDGPQILQLRTLEFGHTPFMPLLLPAMLKRINNNDIIHLHFAQFYLPEIVAIHYYIRKIPYVFHFHGDVLPSGHLGHLIPYYKRYVLPVSLHKASVVVFPSKDFRERMTTIHPFLKSAKSVVIPNGIQQPSNVHHSFKTKDKYFMYVGRLTKIKNLSFIINAFHVARQEDPKIRLLIIGGGECEAELKNLVSSLGETSSIEFTGIIAKEKISKLYERAVTLLVASGRESFGMSIVEAMSHGVPVIACLTPGVREIVKDNFNGYTSTMDIKVFVSNILKAAQRGNDYQLLSQNAAKTAQKYTLPKIVDSFSKLYESIRLMA